MGSAPRPDADERHEPPVIPMPPVTVPAPRSARTLPSHVFVDGHGREWPGWAAGSRWDGYDEVWIDDITRRAIIRLMDDADERGVWERRTPDEHGHYFIGREVARTRLVRPLFTSDPAR